MSYTYTTNNTTTPNITLTNGTSTTGTYFTTTGTGTGSTWINPVLTVQNAPAGLEVKGKVVINGQDLEERLKVIEQVLTIPERDVKLEKKHPKLKKMHDDYIKELAKYRMWESIKGEEE